MKVYNLSTAEKLPKNIDAWRLYQGKQVEFLQLQLKQGEQIEVHKNSLDVLFYVLEGTGQIHMNGEVLDTVSGDCIPVEKDTDRGWSNTGKNLLKLLVVKLMK